HLAGPVHCRRDCVDAVVGLCRPPPQSGRAAPRPSRPAGAARKSAGPAGPTRGAPRLDAMRLIRGVARADLPPGCAAAVGTEKAHGPARLSAMPAQTLMFDIDFVQPIQERSIP